MEAEAQPQALPERAHAQTTVGAPSPDETAAYALALALGEALPPAERMAALQARLEALTDPTSPAALSELARQVPLLEGLFHRFTVDALRTTRVDNRVALLKAAIYAQQAHARTVALLRTLGAADSVVDVH